MSFIPENTLHLQTLFSGLTISPETLIDSVISMWVIISLPDRFKTTMELWLGKCKVENKSPSLDDTWEVISKCLQHCENSNDHSNQALLASRNNNTNNKQNNNQQKIKQDGDYPKCSPGWHNPLTKHNESDCNFLKGDRNGLGNNKPIQSLIASTIKHHSKTIILDSGATTSMFRNPEMFTTITQLTQSIELAKGSSILASGIGTVRVELLHCFLDLSNCLLIKELS
ncbi:hypothetical protein O181_089347 [Austropuccinia psidii MF-1]|uniref:Retrovirus-related Pol polyprotein from transposon TNT 1-94-like beta-barrel domain-containing protein n=1 Tax=Austropuccinia psidii MF-1 TaxID=1389203 RepID=A0A9Q3ITE8_9BASI|nr:hypothetical protein [Austropuccinia psidii MF-1]